MSRNRKYRDFGVYLFDDNFNLKSYTVFSESKKEKIVIGRVSYEYNQKNILISSENEFVGNYIYYDSIVYDNQGLVSCEFHSSKVWTKKSGYVINQKENISRVLFQKLDNYYVISNSLNKDSIKWKIYYDNQNVFQKAEYIDRIDSVSRYVDNMGCKLESYWYKYASDSVFTLGLQREFDNELLIKESMFQMLTYNLSNEVTKHYLYNELDQLTLTYETESHYMNKYNKEVLYFYDGRGFLHHTYAIYNYSKPEVHSYSYHTTNY